MKQQIINCLLNAKRVTIFSHINTDGDAIGASLAFFHFLKDNGVSANIVTDSTLPNHIKFLPDIGEVNKDMTLAGDVALILDCNTTDRIGRFKFKLNRYSKIINIDHHNENSNFGDYNFVIPEYSSSCEMIYDIFVSTNVSITKDIARSLMVGILTDTGSLAYDCVTPNTLKKMARLLEISKMNIRELTQQLYCNNSLNIFELKKYCYNNLELLHNNEVAFIGLNFNALKQCGIDVNDTKVVTEIGLSLAPVKLVIIISEAEPGVNYVSFRAKGIDCSKFAKEFGGGGHTQASGCRIYDNFENACNQLKEVVIKKW